jgi:hypothetical protein
MKVSLQLSLLLMLLLAGCGTRVLPSPTYRPSATADPVQLACVRRASTPPPPGGLTADQATAIGRDQMLARGAGPGGSPANVVCVVAGQLGEFRGTGTLGGSPDRWVWKVVLTGTWEEGCGPPPPPSPQPDVRRSCPPPSTSGFEVIDYFTGEWVFGATPAVCEGSAHRGSPCYVP